MKARNGSAAATSIVILGMAITAVWLLMAPGLFGSSASSSLTGPAAAAVEPVDDAQEVAVLSEGVRVVDLLQVTQPRDPFRPLITQEPEPPPNGEDPNGNGNGNGFDPTGMKVTLEEVRTGTDGELEAVLTVDGTEYVAKEGETFAGSFQVVSLTSTGGTFLFGDNAFNLSVGQEILK